MSKKRVHKQSVPARKAASTPVTRLPSSNEFLDGARRQLDEADALLGDADAPLDPDALLDDVIDFSLGESAAVIRPTRDGGGVKEQTAEEFVRHYRQAGGQ